MPTSESMLVARRREHAGCPPPRVSSYPQLLSLANFYQLPLPLRLNKSSCRSLQRYHFIKSLKPISNASLDDERERTLLIANFDGTPSDLQIIYGRYGTIARVDVGNKRQTAVEKGVGRVVFDSSCAVRNVLDQSLRQAQANSQQVAADEEEAEEAAAAVVANIHVGSSDEDDDGWATADADAEDEPIPPPPNGIKKWLTEYYAQRPGP